MMPRLIEYGRDGDMVVIGSGCGITMAAMDDIRAATACIDIDEYRGHAVDWEMFGATVDALRCRAVIMVGWYTVDEPRAMNAIARGISRTPIYRYDGGGGESYADWIKSIPMQAISLPLP